MGNSRRRPPGFLGTTSAFYSALVIFLCLLSASIMICVLLSIALVVMAPAAQCKSVDKRDADSHGIDVDDLFKLPSIQMKKAPIGGEGGVDRQAPPIGQEGGMGRQMPFEFDTDSLFTEENLQARDVNEHTDRFMETLKLAAAEHQGKQLKRKLDTRGEGHFGTHHVVTCVYCDSRCEARAKNSGYADAKAYFEQAIAQMNTIVQGGLNENMDFELMFVLLPYKITEMSWYFDYSAQDSVQLLTGINNNFWKESGLYKTAATNGCDLDYLVVDTADSGWRYMGSIEGIANMFQLCLGSYSTVQMNANPISLAKLMTHEYGHMIGIYHDGVINPSFSGMSHYFDEGQMLAACKAEYDNLAATCTSSSVGCPSGKCIMSATVDGTDWSDCSVAYYTMYNCLTTIPSMATFYDDSCTLVEQS